MKGIFKAAAVAAAALMAISCELTEGNVNPLTRNELVDYASLLYRNHVLLPADMAELSIELDAYMAMTDEQKLENLCFHRKVHEIGDGVYQFLDDYVTCVVDTGGDSVWDEGAEWTFIEYSSKSFAGKAWNAWITDEVKLTFNSDTIGEAMLMVQIESAHENVLMALKSRSEGVNTWNMSVHGTDMGSNGLRSEYSSGIGTGGIDLQTAPSTEDEGKYSRLKLSEGTFYVDIYDDDAKIDWVLVHFRSGSNHIYETSR